MASVERYREHTRELAGAFGVRLIEDSGLLAENAFALTPRLKEETARRLLVGPGHDLMWWLRDRHRFVGMVVHAPVIDETSYVIVLHEMGHVLSPTGSCRSTERIEPGSIREANLALDEEEAAWEWARRYACEWTPAMEQVRQIGMQSYEQGKVQAVAIDSIANWWESIIKAAVGPKMTPVDEKVAAEQNAKRGKEVASWLK